MRYMSIPRLELEGALLLLQLRRAVSQAYPDMKNNMTYWTDSKIILGWISMSSKIMKIVIRNRISTIHEETAIKDWRFVPTHLNPADLVSRGCAVETLRGHTLWFAGPPFLRGVGMEPNKPEVVYTDEIKDGLKKGGKCLGASTFLVTDGKGRTGLRDWVHSYNGFEGCGFLSRWFAASLRSSSARGQGRSIWGASTRGSLWPVRCISRPLLLLLRRLL